MFNIIKRFFIYIIVVSLFVGTTYVPIVAAPINNLDFLPAPGAQVDITEPYEPFLLKGLSLYPDNPLLLDFIFSKGDASLDEKSIRKKSLKLIKYFLACLTLPEEDFWVNLSPLEVDRVMVPELAQTDMGKDLLAQDYLLKQLAATLTSPEKPEGQNFWNRLYENTDKQVGSGDIISENAHKIWIAADKAYLNEYGLQAIVADASLKVMIAEEMTDLPQGLQRSVPTSAKKSQPVRERGMAVMKETILPIIDKEVNHGQHFVSLRQMYYAMVLATWYKRKLKESILNQVYISKKRIGGIELADKDLAEKVYQQYLESVRVGVFNFIREEMDVGNQKIIARRYFSGGVVFKDHAILTSPINNSAWKKAVMGGLLITASLLPVHLGDDQKTTGGPSTGPQTVLQIEPPGKTPITSDRVEVFYGAHGSKDDFQRIIPDLEVKVQEQKDLGRKVVFINEWSSPASTSGPQFWTQVQTFIKKNQGDVLVQIIRKKIMGWTDQLLNLPNFSNVNFRKLGINGFNQAIIEFLHKHKITHVLEQSNIGLWVQQHRTDQMILEGLEAFEKGEFDKYFALMEEYTRLRIQLYEKRDELLEEQINEILKTGDIYLITYRGSSHRKSSSAFQSPDHDRDVVVHTYEKLFGVGVDIIVDYTREKKTPLTAPQRRFFLSTSGVDYYLVSYIGNKFQLNLVNTIRVVNFLITPETIKEEDMRDLSSYLTRQTLQWRNQNLALKGKTIYQWLRGKNLVPELNQILISQILKDNALSIKKNKGAINFDPLLDVTGPLFAKQAKDQLGGILLNPNEIEWIMNEDKALLSSIFFDEKLLNSLNLETLLGFRPEIIRVKNLDPASNAFGSQMNPVFIP